MKYFLPLFALILSIDNLCAAEPPFEIREGDRVLLLGDTLLERENSYGYLETRMHEQFPDRRFIVRNLSWAGDTPLGWSRASFDGPAKGWERLKEQIALVKPTVVFLGYGMAASLQEMTDRSGDATLNPDPARYGADAMSAARFKKELAQLMEAIETISGFRESGNSGIAIEPAAPGGKSEQQRAAAPDSKSRNPSVRFVLLSPIRHEDLRAVRPGLPDPAEHNKMLEQYSKAIEELAKERGARFVDLPDAFRVAAEALTDNGIHLSMTGFERGSRYIKEELGWGDSAKYPRSSTRDSRDVIRAAILRKNELFFHRFRPANSTYLFGFRKHEQGQNAAEIPKFDPLIEQADAEIDRLKRTAATAQAPAPSPQATAPAPKNVPSQPIPEFAVADGYQIQLWAENPLLEKPTQMNWDALGRLWVVSSSLYPQIEPGAIANDKVLILEDTDRDGKADKSEVFAEGLLIPTGVEPDLKSAIPGIRESGNPGIQSDGFEARSTDPKSRNGCYVGQSTELLHFSDTDNDSKADTRRIVLSGFGTEDTHHIIHTLHWGPDGRLYFNQSVYIHSHLETPYGIVRLNSGGIFAYDPRTERLEVFARGWWNSWGHQMDKWGQSFATDGAGNTGISWVIPGAVYDAYEGSRRVAPRICPGSYPKFCGLELLYSPHFPADWQGNAVTCDFRAHRIVRFAMKDLAADNPGVREFGNSGIRSAATSPQVAKTTPREAPDSKSGNPEIPKSRNSPSSAGYVAEEQPDFIRTNDLSFRPIDVKMGPDGAIYVADWSNPIIQHGEVDFRDPRRDHHRGRIWRITKKDTPAVKWEALVGKKNEELLEKLLSDSIWEKEQARRVVTARGAVVGAHDWGALAESDKTGVRTTLVQWTKNKSAGRATAAWDVARSIGFDYYHQGPAGHMFQAGALFALLNDSEARWRANAARRAGEWLTRPVYEYDSDCEGIGFASVLQKDELPRLPLDSNPRVRLEAIRALARIPTARSAELVLDAIIPGEAKGTSELADPFLEYAAWLSINELAKPWTDAIASGEWKIEAREKQLAYGLTAINPALAGAALSNLIDAGKVPLDGSGPWIELIGKAGGPKELRKIFTIAETNKFGIDAKTRVVETLVEAARLRNARPAAIALQDRPHAEAIRKRIADLPKVTSEDLDIDQLLDWHTEHGGGGPTDNKPANIRLRLAITRLMGYWPPAEPLYLEYRAKEDEAPGMAAAACESLARLGNRQLLAEIALEGSSEGRQHALPALAGIDPSAALTVLQKVLVAHPNQDEKEALPFWRGLLGAKDFPDKLARALPKEFPKPAATIALRVSRELGRRGEKLSTALAPIAGASGAATPLLQDYKWMVDLTKRDGDPARGESIYRRANLACVTCHAIGGAGGKIGPDMTSLGASVQPDYIIESMLNPAAKVKEGYNAVSFALNDGTEVSGILSRETAQEFILRDATGKEQSVPKAKITGKTSIGSIMPAGLVDALPDREKWDLFAFLGQLGKPGPFDASKGHVARVWSVLPDPAKREGAGAKVTNNALSTAPILYTNVDGRLPQEQLREQLKLVQLDGEVVQLVARFENATAGPVKLNIHGASEAWLDGQPLSLTGPAPRLEVGTHALSVRLDLNQLPELLRAESSEARFLGN